EDADDDIREYLRGYKKKRHTPSGLPKPPLTTVNMSTDSDPPSYRTGALATQITQVMVGALRLARNGQHRHADPRWAGQHRLPKYVKYDLTPRTRLFRHPRCQPPGSHPTTAPQALRPLAKVKDLTPTQLRLFNQRALPQWVEEALDSEADRGLTAEARMEREAKTLQLLVTHKMEALADLLAADATTASLTGCLVYHLNLPTTDEEAYKAYREVTRIPPAEPKVRYTLRHTSLPHANACNLRAYRVQQERDHRFRATKKRCHRCRKFGHIRAHCPTKYNRF
ncbi:hypothetical protein BJV77DRAFT_963181, partial [Russula vinacea]